MRGRQAVGQPRREVNERRTPHETARAQVRKEAGRVGGAVRDVGQRHHRHPGHLRQRHHRDGDEIQREARKRHSCEDARGHREQGEFGAQRRQQQRDWHAQPSRARQCRSREPDTDHDPQRGAKGQREPDVGDRTRRDQQDQAARDGERVERGAPVVRLPRQQVDDSHDRRADDRCATAHDPRVCRERGHRHPAARTVAGARQPQQP